MQTLEETELSREEPKPDTEGVLLSVRKIGNSIGGILPRDLLTRLKLNEGDALHVIEGAERTLKRSPYDPHHAKAMEIARRSFRDYANTDRASAK